MSRFVHNSMSSEAAPFSLSIDKFSLHVRRGYYESSKLQGGKWSIVLNLSDSDGDGYDDFIEVQLKRNEFDGRDNFVELRVSIVDCLGLNCFTKEGKFCFNGSRDVHKVLSVNRMSALGKLRYLPNDTLTLRGEMMIYQETETPFESEEDFEKSLKSSISALAATKAVLLFLWSAAADVCHLVADKTSRYVVPTLVSAPGWIKSVLSNIHSSKNQPQDDVEAGNSSDEELGPEICEQSVVNMTDVVRHHNKPVRNGGNNVMCIVMEERYFKSMKNGHGQYTVYPSNNRGRKELPYV